ncbi:MAG: hypothetical protein EP330_11265 [Deltaproteobacteria bacterium]|nr:MAG: hypothetical protein EP330_11265 [Deltaproteobacteria bacterium]
MRLGLIAGMLALGVGCAGSGAEPEPACVTDNDCDPLQVCGDGGDQPLGVCLWLPGRTFHVDFLSAEVHGGASDDGDGTTWDLVVPPSDGGADLKGGVSQGLDERLDCTGYGEDEAMVTFADVTDNVSLSSNCILVVEPGQPLTLYLVDHDNPGDGGGEDDIIDTWTFEGEEGYASLLREPATKRLEGTWSSVFITVYDF